MKDKLFFWWNQEWNKEIQGVSFAFCVPTAAEDGGDFSGYGTGTHGSMRRDYSYDSGLRPGAGNPEKIANPDAAGLLIAQFYPLTDQSTTHQREQLGRVALEQAELERVERPRRL